VCGPGMLGEPGFRVRWLCWVGLGPALQTQDPPGSIQGQEYFLHIDLIAVLDLSKFVVLYCFFWYKNTWTLNYDVISQKIRVFFGYDVIIGLYFYMGFLVSGRNCNLTQPWETHTCQTRYGYSLGSRLGWCFGHPTWPESHTINYKYSYGTAM